MILIVICAFAYLFPTIVAIVLGRRNALAVFALNLMLGWTALGWIVSMVWALTADPRR